MDPQRILRTDDQNRSVPGPPIPQYFIAIAYIRRLKPFFPPPSSRKKFAFFKFRPNKFWPFVGRSVLVRTFSAGAADFVSEHLPRPPRTTSPPIIRGPGSAELVQRSDHWRSKLGDLDQHIYPPPSIPVFLHAPFFTDEDASPIRFGPTSLSLVRPGGAASEAFLSHP